MKSKPAALAFAAVMVGVLLLGLVTVLAVVRPKKSVTLCERRGKTHYVVMNRDGVEPKRTVAKLCDSIEIKNTDPQTAKIGFGDRNKHEEFSGVSEKILRRGQSFTLLLTETGNISFHDHYHHDTEGVLIVE